MTFKMVIGLYPTPILSFDFFFKTPILVFFQIDPWIVFIEIINIDGTILKFF